VGNGKWEVGGEEEKGLGGNGGVVDVDASQSSNGPD